MLSSGEQSLLLSYARKLDIAVRSNNLDDVELILKEPLITPNIKDLDGFTLAHVAVGVSPQVLQLLLQHKQIDVNIKNNNGNTAFHYFCSNATLDIVKTFDMFVKKGVSVNMQNDSGETALHRACLNTSTGRLLVILLCKNGANPNVQNTNGDTPLHYAVRLRREDLVYLLLRGGADPNVRSRDGMALVDVAQREAGQTRISDILQRHDAYQGQFDESLNEPKSRMPPVTRHTGPPTLLSLPWEVLANILSHASDRRLCAIGQTCLKMRIIASNNINWYTLCLNNCCSRCCRCFKWSHTVHPSDTVAGVIQNDDADLPFGYYKQMYKQKFERCIALSDQPQAVRRTMHRRCIFCSGARRDPGVPPPRLPNEPAAGQPLAHPDYNRAAGIGNQPAGVRDTMGAQQFQTGTFARPNVDTTRFDQFDADDDAMPVGVSAGTMQTMMPSSLQEAKRSWSRAHQQQQQADRQRQMQRQSTIVPPSAQLARQTSAPRRFTNPPAVDPAVAGGGAALYGGGTRQIPSQNTANNATTTTAATTSTNNNNNNTTSAYMPVQTYGTQAIRADSDHRSSGVQPAQPFSTLFVGDINAVPSKPLATSHSARAPHTAANNVSNSNNVLRSNSGQPPATTNRFSAPQPTQQQQPPMQQGVPQQSYAPQVSSSLAYNAAPAPQQSYAPAAQRQPSPHTIQPSHSQQSLASQPNQPNANQFSAQIQTLRSMGFMHDEAECVRALSATNGNVDAAVGILLS